MGDDGAPRDGHGGVTPPGHEVPSLFSDAGWSDVGSLFGEPPAPPGGFPPLAWAPPDQLPAPPPVPPPAPPPPVPPGRGPAPFGSPPAAWVPVPPPPAWGGWGPPGSPHPWPGPPGFPGRAPGWGRGTVVLTTVLSVVLAGVLFLATTALVAAHRPGAAVGPGVTVAPTVVRSTPVPIVLGTLMMGGDGPPIPWSTARADRDTAVGAVPGGLDVHLLVPRIDDWTLVPVHELYQSTEITGDVQLTAGPAGNAVGLGCLDSTGRTELSFRVAGGTWEIVDQRVGADEVPALIDRGSSSAVSPTTTPNRIAISCRDDRSVAGTTRVQMAVNGVPVADDVLGIRSAGWAPTVVVCSCSGTDAARFTDIAQYADAA